MMLKGKVIDPIISEQFGMKELLVTLEHQNWTRMFLFPLHMMYWESMLDFYSKFNMLEDDKMSIVVRGVDLVFNTDTLGEILRVPMNRFNTYIQCEWLSLVEKEDEMYLTTKYTQGR